MLTSGELGTEQSFILCLKLFYKYEMFQNKVKHTNTRKYITLIIKKKKFIDLINHHSFAAATLTHLRKILRPLGNLPKCKH